MEIGESEKSAPTGNWTHISWLKSPVSLLSYDGLITTRPHNSVFILHIGGTECLICTLSCHSAYAAHFDGSCWVAAGIFSPPNNKQVIISSWDKMLYAFGMRELLNMGSLLTERIPQSNPNWVLTAHAEWLLNLQLWNSVSWVQYI